ncbi:MAG: hypothetical protein U5R30_11100 [Deltaproteobacteria bacterium]|nr:hypothetical protein [Deltaproteobacteria bacterium]
MNLWTALAGEAARAGVSFFIFPGGRLDSLPDSEYLRNSIYRLANAENLDSLISWGSSLGGAVTIGELEKFHHALDPLPYVTIAHKMAGSPRVEFDAYTGMKTLMHHFIKVHGARKIAFIRGPSSHLSAEDRFRAYEDALAEAEPGEAEPGEKRPESAGIRSFPMDRWRGRGDPALLKARDWYRGVILIPSWVPAI